MTFIDLIARLQPTFHFSRWHPGLGLELRTPARADARYLSAAQGRRLIDALIERRKS